MTVAVCKRQMQFESGPEHHTFYACAEHRVALETGEVMCFLRLVNHPVVTLEADEIDDEIECYFCRDA